jgi:hypothetical protein
VIVNAWLADRYLDGVGRAEVKRIACANHIDPGRQAGSGPIVVVNGDHNIVASCDESGYRDCDDIDGSKLPPTRHRRGDESDNRRNEEERDNGQCHQPRDDWDEGAFGECKGAQAVADPMTDDVHWMFGPSVRSPLPRTLRRVRNPQWSHRCCLQRALGGRVR